VEDIVLRPERCNNTVNKKHQRGLTDYHLDIGRASWMEFGFTIKLHYHDETTATTAQN
jgi:hypothetical protein